MNQRDIENFESMDEPSDKKSKSLRLYYLEDMADDLKDK
jgi:hypothetical protein|tara:strand:+ start:916 stop:1032 length:117 start_codon:yes stop_codon:yes gene_type:complete